MAKSRTLYVCANCGHEEPKWMGRCPACQSWDAMEEQAPPLSRAGGGVSPKAARPVPLSKAAVGREERLPTGIGELDRVLGGGLVAGMAVLVGGEPGIGKSTLMLQLAANLSKQRRGVLYVSAEESGRQLALRAGRLGVAGDQVMVLAETGLETAMQAASSGQWAALVVDSVQAVRAAELSGAPGSVGQVRHCAAELTALAKGLGLPLFLVGHVTKEGALAGPRVLEHLVDTVLYFESETGGALRLLRAVKNRFGATDEVGVFEMGEKGLAGVANPSALFLAGRPAGAPGSAVAAAINGSRPLLVEVQALVSPSGLAMPRRQALGVDAGRLHMLCAVLGIHAGLDVSAYDVFVNVTGGLKLSEPAADMAVAAAVASSFKNQPLQPDVVCIGEVGLAGELRGVSRLSARLSEAARQGFKVALTGPGKADKKAAIRLATAQRLADGLEILF